MRQTLGIILATVAATLFAAPAFAQVHYVGNFQNFYTVDFTTPTFITSTTTLTPAQANCSPLIPVFVCDSVTFDPKGGLSDQAGANGHMIFNNAPFFGGGSFGDGALNHAGTYVDNGNGSTLSVSAAPEASTWAMLVLGLGVAGGALRRKRLERPAAA